MKFNIRNIVMLAAAASILAPAAIAQTTATATATTSTTAGTPQYTVNQRKQNQQQRIGEGVENGSLTAGEAAKLENKETKLNREERRFKSDGNLSPAERAKLQRQQNALSADIYKQKHDAQHQNLNPKTEVGQRQRNQQERIGQGIESGQLTANEARKLENHQSAVNHEIHNDRQANGGTLTAQERAQVNRQQNRNSKAIYHQKHDRQHR